MKKILILVSILLLVVSTTTSFADTKEAEKTFFLELNKDIPLRKLSPLMICTKSGRKFKQGPVRRSL